MIKAKITIRRPKMLIETRWLTEPVLVYNFELWAEVICVDVYANEQNVQSCLFHDARDSSDDGKNEDGLSPVSMAKCR